MNDDATLLRRYAEDRTEEAFTEAHSRCLGERPSLDGVLPPVLRTRVGRVVV